MSEFINDIDPSLILPDDQIDAYSIDKSSSSALRPLSVLQPTTHDECVSIMQAANRHQMPVVIRGAGSGTTGGAVPTGSVGGSKP